MLYSNDGISNCAIYLHFLYVVLFDNDLKIPHDRQNVICRSSFFLIGLCMLLHVKSAN